MASETSYLWDYLLSAIGTGNLGWMSSAKAQGDEANHYDKDSHDKEHPPHVLHPARGSPSKRCEG